MTKFVYDMDCRFRLMQAILKDMDYYQSQDDPDMVDGLRKLYATAAELGIGTRILREDIEGEGETPAEQIFVAIDHYFDGC